MLSPLALSATNPLTTPFPAKYICTYHSSAPRYPSLSRSSHLSSDAHYPSMSISLSAGYSGLSIAASQTWSFHFSHPSPPTLHTSNKQPILGRKICGWCRERRCDYTDKEEGWWSRCYYRETTLCSITGKHPKFERKPVRQSTRPFELIHSDLCGPMPSRLGGARYYILFIDDCTRYVEIYLLVTKSLSEIQAKFEEYKAWVEAQGFRIRRFRSDNGTSEYQNSVFLQTLALSGITFEPAPPYTQHRNGVTERMIQTLNSTAWCLLLDVQLPARFWGEAIKTSAYLHRRTPTSSLEGYRSPFEALYGTNPPVHHLRGFGCKVY